MRSLLILAFCTVLLSCTPTPHSEQLLALDTVVDLTIYSDGHASAHEASTLISAEFDRIHTWLSPWAGNGELASINRAIKQRSTVQTTPAMLDLIHQANSLADQTQSLFHPALGDLISLWGFSTNPRPQNHPIPTADDIAIWRTTFDPTHRIPDDLNAYEHSIDFGAIAKGYALSRAKTILEGLKINAALINAGGDLVAIGDRPDRPWKVGLRHPRLPDIFGVVTLKAGESIVTSGDYERAFVQDDARYHHLLNPFIGMPSHDIISVTVIDQDPVRADAFSTAIAVANADQWQSIARANLTLFIVIDKDSHVFLSEAMADRLDQPPSSEWTILPSL